MVPVAGEDAVLHGAAMQGKTHVRAAVVDGMQLPMVVEDHDGDRALGHHQGTSGPNFLQRSDMKHLSSPPAPQNTRA